MAVISLLTDFGVQDEFVGVMHGVILAIAPRAQIVDLCHEVPPGDRRRAAYLLDWSHRYFPKGTIHVAVVDPGVGTARRILCAQAHNQIFLAPDNGVLTQALESSSSAMLYEVRRRRYWLPKVSRTFHGRDIFAPVAAHLARGVRPLQLGPRTATWERLHLPVVQRNRRRVHGTIIDLDRFGNLVTNLDEETVGQGTLGGLLTFRIKGRVIRGLVPTYEAVAQGKLVAMVGSRGLVEIAVRQGNAAKRLQARVGDPVLVETV